MKCLYCHKELEQSSTKPKKFCSDSHRKAYTRETGENGQEEKKTDRENGQNMGKTDKKVEITDKITDTGEKTDMGPKKLIFTKDMPMKKRLELYHERYPDSSFVPNWVEHGFLSQEAALQYAMKCVKDNPATHNLGLGND